ncbi:MAG: DUF1569 domain-containing protein [Nitrospinota bacterium]|nr:DUF1569 domain-containing protein [Nitrospinota bacterium]
MEKRKLSFESYGEVVQEIESLEQSGYEIKGKWSLGQACAHLDYYYKGSLDGFDHMFPWVVRALFGKLALWWYLRVGDKEGNPTVPQSVPMETIDAKKSIADIKNSLRRLATAERLHPSGLFGALSVEQWKILHLKHAAHHLGFLIPKS